MLRKEKINTDFMRVLGGWASLNMPIEGKEFELVNIGLSKKPGEVYFYITEEVELEIIIFIMKNVVKKLEKISEEGE